MAKPAQNTSNLKPAQQPVEDGDNCTTIMHNNKMPPDGYLLAEEPGGAPHEGTNLEHLANKDQVSTTEDGDTLDCGRDKVASTLVSGDR